ncbi:DUF4810 domain-containing protein [Bergeriella denitrificans]|uniref:Putative lipoprotein n=1 Tax=Bergeriella denitrificans TaxID=494 RepID=A0A378UFD7_BERDE|nr:DUF4810 domain-containing protein [Bergeriella denitrificans]STZ76046.1 putative lipoprotein [Bergeriella denitrificans]
MKNTLTAYALPLAAALLLAACGSAPKSMYYWKNYNDTVYQHLKNDDGSLGKQISKMEKYFNEANLKQQAVAPGAHAHMGLLMVAAGQPEAAYTQFEAEKNLFPESSIFMDFLMKNKAKKGKK